MKAPPKPDPQLAELRRPVSEDMLSKEEAAPAMDRLRPAPSNEPDLSQAADAYHQVVSSLRESLDADDIAAARPLQRQLIGPITVVPTTLDGERFLTANFAAVAANSAKTAGEGRLVAGA